MRRACEWMSVVAESGSTGPCGLGKYECHANAIGWATVVGQSTRNNGGICSGAPAYFSNITTKCMKKRDNVGHCKTSETCGAPKHSH